MPNRDDIQTNPNVLQPPMDQSDMENAYINYRDTTFGYLNTMYKNYFMYTADRRQALVKDKESWRTNIK